MKKLIYLLMSLSFVAFVSCSNGTESGTENGYEWVDLGLPSGTKWATCNVGANNPEDYGNYYAWGEITTKKTYSMSTYLDGRITSSSVFGTVKDLLKGVTDVAGTQYDAAKANWGDKWSMPTWKQWEELMEECYWVWTDSYNGSNVAGWIVCKAKSSSDKGMIIDGYHNTPSAAYSLFDAHIFLPAAGYRLGGDLNHAGSNGQYWASSLNASSIIARGFSFGSRNVFFLGGHRWEGRSVRAVISGSKSPDSVDDISVESVTFYKSGIQDGHDYVDLGLPSGIKWATMNVGADIPEEDGNYYAWGETTTREEYQYSWGFYKYYNEEIPCLTKYCNTSTWGEIDNKTTLDLEDDAAYVNWGGKWRIPTWGQWEELISECYWVHTKGYNGSNSFGWIVYKAKNSSDKGMKIDYNETPSASYSLSDSHIFLPYTTDIGGGYGGDGGYWSSSLDTDSPLKAWCYESPYTGRVDNVANRNRGRAVRAVCSAE